MFDADELFVPGNGNIYVADLGSTLPDNAADAVDAAFADLGFVSEDGVQSTPSMTINIIRGWQSFYPLRRSVQDRDLAIAITLLQHNEDTLALYFGGATVSGSGSAWKVSPPDPSKLDARSFVIDGKDGDRIYRLVLPSAMVVEAGQTSWTRTAAAGLPLTISPLATGDADPWDLYVDDAEFPAYPG